MIVANDVTMKFYTPGRTPTAALTHLSCQIPRGCIYGMIGSNGAGKSTFLRLLSGVFRPESGEITVDGAPVWEHPAIKSRIVYIPDELYFLPQASLDQMAAMYRALYPRFDRKRYGELCEQFTLDPTVHLATYSKGMRRQAATILALSSMPDYLLLDETFDGLDPVMRQLVKRILYSDVVERQMTTIITSHSLHELEDTCDQLALLHQGGIVLQSEMQELRTSLFKVQTAFATPFTKQKFEGLDILSYTQMGSVCTFILRGDRAATEATIRAMSPLLFDLLPLSLEEIFIHEMAALGYSFDDMLK